MSTDSQPGPRLRPPRNLLDPRAITWWRLTALGTSGVPAAIALVLALAAPDLRPWSWIALAATFAWLAVDVLVVPGWRMRVHRWEVTDEAVYASAGWWVQEWRLAPISRIQTIDTTRGPLQRHLGLASIEVTTASAAGAITIAGLDAELARELVDRLTTITQATPDDAT